MTNPNHRQRAFAGNKVANCAEYKRCKEVVSKMANLKFEISKKNIAVRTFIKQLEYVFELRRD